MKEVTIEVLKEAASRLMLELTPGQYAALLAEAPIMQKQMESISKIEGLDQYEPMTFPFDCTSSYLREDIPEPPLSVEEALGNASSKLENQIKIPKVVEK